MTLADKVRQVIADYVGVPIDQIMVSTSLKDLDLDSLDVVQLSMECEEVFGIEIPTRELQDWNKVSDVIMYLDREVKYVESGNST